MLQFIVTPRFIGDGTAKVLMHPSRYSILQYLREKREPQYVGEIAKAVGIHPRMASHHLDVLEHKGLTASKYELQSKDGSKRGVAVRLCWPLPRADEVLREIRQNAK